MQMRETIGKSRNTMFFQWFVAQDGRKVGSPKRRVRSQLARWEMKKCTPLWCEAHFEVKTHHGRTTFGSWDVEKVHAVVARSTFRSQNVQNTPWSDHFWKLRCRKSACRCGAKHISNFEVKMHETHHCRTKLEVEICWDVEKVHAVVVRSTFRSQNTPWSDHFWKLRCRKSARRCGAKHISKSKCTKHTMVGPFFEVEMSKKCTPLWREAHFEFRSQNARNTPVSDQIGSWDAEKVRAFVVRSTFWSQNTPWSDHFWKLRCRKSARRCGAKHISKWKCTMWKKCTPLWREAHVEVKMLKKLGVRTTFGGSDVASRGRRKGLCTLSKVSKTSGFCNIFNYNHHYTTLHSNTLHYTTTTATTTPSLHSTTLHSTTLHSTTLQLHSHYSTLHYTTLQYTTLPSTTLHYITLHYTPQHYNYNYTTTHSTTLHTTLHYTPLHYNYNYHYTLHLHSTTLNYTTLLHYITLHSTTLHYTTLHYTTLHYFTTLHYTPLHYNYNYTTLLHSTTLHYITLHCTTLHSTTLHYTTLHYITLNDTAPQIDR